MECDRSVRSEFVLAQERFRLVSCAADPTRAGIGSTRRARNFPRDKARGAFPFLFNSGPDEVFLELSGWTDGIDVSTSSQNHFANLDKIEKLHNSTSAAESDALLKNSRFWYHAEAFDEARLRLLMAGANSSPAFQQLFPTLRNLKGPSEPLLLCYYLFFPGHVAGLDDCEDVENSDKFGSFAGEWACVAILLNNETTDFSVTGAPVTEKWAPIAIGLTSRNVGDIEFLGGERRVGMHVFDFDASVQTVAHDRGFGKQQGIHTRLFVSQGMHGLYLQPSFMGQPVELFTPDDSAAQFCGETELLGKSLDDLQSDADEATRPWVADSAVLWSKALVNLLWAGAEFPLGGGGGLTVEGSRVSAQVDRTPSRDAPGFFRHHYPPGWRRSAERIRR
jgi:hypothetical protein